MGNCKKLNLLVFMFFSKHKHDGANCLRQSICSGAVGSVELMYRESSPRLGEAGGMSPVGDN